MIHPWSLAQTPTESGSLDVVVALGYLSVAAAVAAIAFWLIRRWLHRGAEDDAVPTGFTLADLRQLHRDGELTDEQFAAAKAALIARGLASMGGFDDEAEADRDGASIRSHATAQGPEPNARGLSDGSTPPDDSGSSDKSGGEPGGDDPSPKRDE